VHQVMYFDQNICTVMLRSNHPGKFVFRIWEVVITSSHVQINFEQDGDVP